MTSNLTHYDAIIVGGGPAGLSAALNLGRARKRVLLCDAGARRNAAAAHMHGFVTRDGITPAEFRRIGREQLAPYAQVQVQDVQVERIGGASDAFELQLSSGHAVAARRILLCTGMVDELPGIEGLPPLWGRSVFICPYCHGWEVQDRRFGVLVPEAAQLEYALLLRGWSRDVTVLTNGRYAVPAEMQARLAAARVAVEPRRIARLASNGGPLAQVEFVQGDPLPLEVLFTRPAQQQVGMVQALVQTQGLALDAHGYVQVDEHRRTSVPGLYAAGDLATPMQSAAGAVAAGALAAAMLNHDLTLQPVQHGK
jgi:thioredoxin reductase